MTINVVGVRVQQHALCFSEYSEAAEASCERSIESDRIKSPSPSASMQNMAGPLMFLTQCWAKAPEIFGSPLSRPYARMNVVFARFSHLPEGHLGKFAWRFSCTQPREGFSFSAVM